MEWEWKQKSNVKNSKDFNGKEHRPAFNKILCSALNTKKQCINTRQGRHGLIAGNSNGAWWGGAENRDFRESQI